MCWRTCAATSKRRVQLEVEAHECPEDLLDDVELEEAEWAALAAQECGRVVVEEREQATRYVKHMREMHEPLAGPEHSGQHEC